MYLRRKIDDYLLAWRNREDKLPLIVKGARQIGKTESIFHFAQKNYENIVSINFVLEPKYKTILSDGYGVNEIIKNISLLDPSKKFIQGKTLIIFDELQEVPDIATSLKAFKLDGRFDVICSGSLLGINCKKIHSNSVGYKTDYEMFSMDFEEFLWAKGYTEIHIDNLLKHMQDGVPFSDTELAVYKKLFLDFCVLGGMPAVVKKYIETGTFSETLEIQRQIQLDYEEDIRKYAEGLDQTKIVSVYRNVPAQLAKENKKFQLSKIDKKARSREYMGCITWLEDAGVISICYCLNYPELPLKGNYDESKYKIYYPDTGLLIASLDEEAQEDLRANKNLGVYKGALYENFVAEAFIKQGLGLYYYKKESATLEEDFFVRTKDELVPVEVKANNNRSRSLRKLISSDSYSDIHWGIKLADSNVGIEDGICTFPYFCTFLLKKYLSGKS
ncbi:ATP-binding protein [Blautia glucerasea]|uniref:ATP-binding protein n=1 Tax=Blautia glucerasea TaxID=536633 RepID=UPI00156F8890|nr:ATP-binding protein [Blautia glucerasea]NSJ27344.1 ATP-binding protein [Blautia glucerasea]